MRIQQNSHRLSPINIAAISAFKSSKCSSKSAGSEKSDFPVLLNPVSWASGTTVDSEIPLNIFNRSTTICWLLTGSFSIIIAACCTNVIISPPICSLTSDKSDSLCQPRQVRRLSIANAAFSFKRPAVARQKRRSYQLCWALPYCAERAPIPHACQVPLPKYLVSPTRSTSSQMH